MTPHVNTMTSPELVAADVAIVDVAQAVAKAAAAIADAKTAILTGQPPSFWHRVPPSPHTRCYGGVLDEIRRAVHLASGPRIGDGQRLGVIESQERPRAEVGHRNATEPDDRPELRAQRRALPKSIRPERWGTGTGVKHVPDSLLIAEEQRHPEGYYPCGS